IMSVADRMVERGMEQDFKILYSARATVANPHYGIPSWLKVLWKMAQADMIFLDDHAPILDWVFLKDDTTLIQLWHAGAGFKSSGYSRWGHTGCPAPNGCHRQYKYGIAGSKAIAHFFSEVWGINTENVLPTGMPRMDEYLDPDYRASKEKELRETFPLINGKRVILFAPTYRGKNHFDAHYPYQLIDFDRLYEFCGDDAVVLFKMHPWVADPVPIKDEHKDRFVDVNKYPNINDLFYVTDLLITDYSSNIFEFSLMRKPMLFFAFDEIQYSFSRGFHRDYEESAPGKVCHTFDEVMTALEKDDFEYEKVEEYVDVHFDYIDSGASDRVIDWIVLGNIPEDIRASIKAVEDDVERLRHLSFASLTPTEETDDEEDVKQDTHD
ncbi:MAG: CDP-glycerol glycerophosphotransferase family protein, partial [Clostridia bacterium]|nr:CDP-glycerol glycerophosphotransferase family protein [Clostridia bacterium]